MNELGLLLGLPPGWNHPSLGSRDSKTSDKLLFPLVRSKAHSVLRF